MKKKIWIISAMVMLVSVFAVFGQNSDNNSNTNVQNVSIFNDTVGTVAQIPEKRVVALNEEQRAMMPKWAAKKSDWFSRKYKLNLDFSDRAAMQAIFKRNKNTGIALAVLGVIFPYFPWFWGTCAIFFYRAGAIGHIYKAVTGKRLFAYLPMPCIDGGVCSKGKELNFAMAIKL